MSEFEIGWLICSSCFTGLIIVIIFFPYRGFLRLLGVNCHVWKYRNPYSRTCIHCGRVENIYGYYGSYSGDRWQQVYPLPENKCNIFKRIKK